MDRIKRDSSIEIVLSYLKEAKYLIQRGYRSQASIRDVFWKSINTHSIFAPTILDHSLLIKKFIHAFINVESTLEALDVYFDGMSRQFWELNKAEMYDFFLDQKAEFNLILNEVVSHLNGLSNIYKDVNNTPFNLNSLQSEGLRSGQSIIEIILFSYPDQLVINSESEPKILLNDKVTDREIKLLHKKMLQACTAHFSELIYYKYFLPFERSPHLPFLKTQ